MLSNKKETEVERLRDRIILCALDSVHECKVIWAQLEAVEQTDENVDTLGEPLNR